MCIYHFEACGTTYSRLMIVIKQLMFRLEEQAYEV